MSKVLAPPVSIPEDKLKPMQAFYTVVELSTGNECKTFAFIRFYDSTIGDYCLDCKNNARDSCYAIHTVLLLHFESGTSHKCYIKQEVFLGPNKNEIYEGNEYYYNLIDNEMGEDSENDLFEDDEDTTFSLKIYNNNELDTTLLEAIINNSSLFH